MALVAIWLVFSIVVVPIVLVGRDRFLPGKGRPIRWGAAFLIGWLGVYTLGRLVIEMMVGPLD